MSYTKNVVPALCSVFTLSLFSSLSYGQLITPGETSESAPATESKRLFGIVPNYRTLPA